MIPFTVKGDDTPPEINIISPKNGDMFLCDQSFKIEFTVNDPETGIVSQSARIDGFQVKSGQVVTGCIDILAGPKLLVVEATNGAGLSASRSIRIDIAVSLESLIKLIELLAPKELQHSLIAKIDPKNFNRDIKGIIGSLEAFINEVNAQQGKKIFFSNAASLRNAALVLIGHLQKPKTIHVWADNPKKPDIPYLTFDTAAKTIKDAMRIAQSGDKIVVRAGLYKENVDMVNGVTLISEEENKKECDKATTGDKNPKIKGDGRHTVLTILNCKDLTTVQGFSITDGKSNFGGAIRVVNSVFRIACNRIAINEANEKGGGISVIDGRGNVEKNFIDGNIAEEGGGMYIESKSGVGISGNIIDSNTSRQTGGGGVSVLLSNNVSITKNMLTRNKVNIGKKANQLGVLLALSSGGGIIVQKSTDIKITKNMFLNNEAGLDGGALSISFDSKVEIIDENIFEKNIANDDGGAIHVTVGGDVTVTKTISGKINEFLGNEAQNNGGAIHATCGAVVKIEHSIIKANKAKNHDGGGLSTRESDITVQFCDFISNSANNSGGGLSGLSTKVSHPSAALCEKFTLKILVSENQFKENIAAKGGGIALRRIPPFEKGIEFFIINNTIEGTRATEGIIISNLAVLTSAEKIGILRNIISKNSSGVLSIDDKLTNIAFNITNNTLEDNDVGISLVNGAHTLQSNTISKNRIGMSIDNGLSKVSDNIFTQNGSIQIKLTNRASCVVENNKLSGNDVTPIGISVSINSKGRVNNNDISGHKEFGLKNEASEILNAQPNWWGDATGPFHPKLNPSGKGDTVSDNVDFSKFLKEPIFK